MLIIFDPARWPHREIISRAAALCIIGIFLGLRIHHFNRFPQHFQDAWNYYDAFKTASGGNVYTALHIKLLWGARLSVWLVETAIYLGYIAAYFSRTAPVAIAKGFMETAFPLVVAGIPMLLAFMPYSLHRWVPHASALHLYCYLGSMTLMGVGGAINLIGLLTLRRSFTIMTEARELVVKGIFRYIRHPLYAGHFIMFLGSLLLRLHPMAITLYLVFCIGQIKRARIEERKLSNAFAQYADYQRRTAMFFPLPSSKRQ